LILVESASGAELSKQIAFLALYEI